jgi:hypothetical protein
MTPAETVGRLLAEAAGEALCDACLAFACSASLDEIRRATEELVRNPSFHRQKSCASCRRVVPATSYLTVSQRKPAKRPS